MGKDQCKLWTIAFSAKLFDKEIPSQIVFENDSATIAPAFLLRLRYALSPSGEGIRLMAQVGGGVMRNTIKLKGQPSGMDTDIVGQGPLLIGAGVGFTKKLGGAVSFVADVSALGGIAVTSKVGGLKVNNGIGADLSLGLALGF